MVVMKNKGSGFHRTVQPVQSIFIQPFSLPLVLLLFYILFLFSHVPAQCLNASQHCGTHTIRCQLKEKNIISRGTVNPLSSPWVIAELREKYSGLRRTNLRETKQCVRIIGLYVIDSILGIYVCYQLLLEKRPKKQKKY